MQAIWGLARPHVAWFRPVIASSSNGIRKLPPDFGPSRPIFGWARPNLSLAPPTARWFRPHLGWARRRRLASAKFGLGLTKFGLVSAKVSYGSVAVGCAPLAGCSRALRETARSWWRRRTGDFPTGNFASSRAGICAQGVNGSRALGNRVLIGESTSVEFWPRATEFDHGGSLRGDSGLFCARIAKSGATSIEFGR